jgi:hypothetical protein
MKSKLFLSVLTLLTASSVFAASATIELQDMNSLYGQKDTRNVVFSVRENINKSVIGDVTLGQVSAVGAGVGSTRVEVGLTGLLPVTSFMTSYTRLGVGDKTTTTTSYPYYNIETGFKTPTPIAGLNTTFGFRFRTAFSEMNKDTTRTIRLGLGYELTKVDTVGVRFDVVRGVAPQSQNVFALNYSRGF